MTDQTKDEAIEQQAKQIRELLAREHLTQNEVEGLLTLARLGGKIPLATGFDDAGIPYWSTADLKEWMQGDECLHVRAAGAVADRQRVADRGRVRSESWNPKERTFDATIITENEIMVRDVLSLRILREVLLADGGSVPSQFPLLADHDRSVSSIIGEGFSPRREGAVWVANFRLAETPAALDVGQLIESNMLTGVSIGYTYGLDDFTEIAPGRTETVAGRSFTNNGNETLRIVFSWTLKETSAVVFPADDAAKIRSANNTQTQRNNPMPTLAPAAHSRNTFTEQPTRGELTSALLLQAGVSDPSECRADHDPRFGFPVLHRQCAQYVRDAERGYAYCRRNAVELLRMAARLDGIHCPTNDPGVVLSTLFSACQRSASTSNLASFFEDAIASLVLSRHNARGDSSTGWCEEVDVNSLKPLPAVRLGGAELTKQPRGGVAENLRFETNDESADVAQYSGKFRIDEQDFLDGRLGQILSTIPQQVGDAAEAMRPNLVYSYLLRNPAMKDGDALFHANHGNLLTSAALAEAALETAASTIARQTENGVKLNLLATHLIVPTVLERTAQKLARLVELRNQESVQPPVVKSDSRLDDGLVDPTTGNTIAGSLTSWYLSTAGRHALQVQYLEGMNRQPQVRTGFLKPETGSFGYSVDVRHILGVTAIDYRGIARNDA